MELEHLGGFPRPDMMRRELQSLEGEWGFEYDAADAGIAGGWSSRPEFSRRITVPFCVESEASGIGDAYPPRVAWYAKDFRNELPGTPGRTLLHFGAVDYRARVWLNGRDLGEHAGGYTPFTFDVGEALEDENILVVRVEDSRDASQPRGKQTMLKRAFMVWYPGVSGIWQPVWLERAGEVYLAGYRVLADLKSGRVRIVCSLAGGRGEARVEAKSVSPLGEARHCRTELEKGAETAVVELELDLGELLPWSPHEPHLYGLELSVESGATRDEVEAYFGVREVRAHEGGIWLNGEPLYQKLVLCQGYFPQGHYTPLDPSWYRRDVALVKELGFNGLRMHQKIEDPRFLFWCDYLGCLVWEEMPSAYRFTPRMREALEREWREVLERDGNHPSIIALVAFNESWGVGVFPLPLNLRRATREYVRKICRLTRLWDPTRPVIDNSGYEHTSETDIVDIHHYLEDEERCAHLYEELRDLTQSEYSLRRGLVAILQAKVSHNPLAKGERYRGQPVIISEYGGFGYYRGGEGRSLQESYRAYTELIQAQEHICGYCYTQLYDLYQERNGLLGFDRVPKVPVEEIRRVNEV
ncbi:MAG: glycoside hydrolase family 2 [Actinobacteria bacterium]|jgi:beta-galactosidase/beta-glucuronidase|nr:MAG: glycoside hydrolase family 2 [Actinomycetota bacterium]